MNIKVAAFYQFIPLPDLAGLQPKLHALCLEYGLRGTVLLAPEGINGTLAGTDSAIAAFICALRSGSMIQPAFDRLELKFSQAQAQVFQRLKIRLKREIVALGQPQTHPQRAGAYIQPTQWNAVLEQEQTLLIDIRNEFEIAMGSFPGALNPQTTRFGDFVAFARKNLDPNKHTCIAMFCTGGIRCEKASAFLLAEGFAQVLQLKGGILNYLEQIPPENSRWQGECFVFDERVTLSHSSFSEPG
jgi:UPF0176 protein